jgi:hypothetical protein
MDAETRVPDYTVEEYRALRSEMIRHMESLDRNVIATITATVVAIAYGLRESPFVLILASIMPIYFWIQHVNNRRKLAKISSYIAVFLEGKNQLMWHRRNHTQMSGPKTSPIRFYSRAFLLPYPVLIIVSVLVSLWSLRHTYPQRWPLWFLALISAIVTLMVGLIAHRADRSFSDLLDGWNARFDAIKKLEQDVSQSSSKFPDYNRS